MKRGRRYHRYKKQEHKPTKAFRCTFGRYERVVVKGKIRKGDKGNWGKHHVLLSSGLWPYLLGSVSFSDKY